MREKLIELLKEADRKAFEITESRPLKHPFEVWELQADHLIANGVTVGDKWVSTAERLPDSGKCVLICAEYGVAEGSYSAYNKSWVQFRWNAEDIKVTHWMPLPQPPKGE